MDCGNGLTAIDTDFHFLDALRAAGSCLSSQVRESLATINSHAHAGGLTWAGRARRPLSGLLPLTSCLSSPSRCTSGCRIRSTPLCSVTRRAFPRPELCLPMKCTSTRSSMGHRWDMHYSAQWHGSDKTVNTAQLRLE